MSDPAPAPPRRRQPARRSKQQQQTLITFMVVCVWVASLIVRVLVPADAILFAGLDSVVLLVFGYMFSASAIKNRTPPPNGDSQ